MSSVDDAARQRFLEQLEEMRRAYVARFPELAEELEVLRARLSAGDGDALPHVEAIVHRLAGTAGSYGLDEISLAATELDTRIKEGAAPTALEDGLGALISLLRHTARGARGPGLDR